jgi:hypothetical protein
MANTEGRIVLALNAYQKNQFPSLRAAARAYNVPPTTLTRRSKGTPFRPNSRPTNLKLTQTEETTLVQWILSMDTRGISPTQALVHEMAELLVAERVQDALAIPPKIGHCWVYRFIKRNPELKARYNRKYDYQRAKCEDPVIIRAWFLLVRNTIAKYGIADEDIYNFDETGFQMGVIATAKVVTSAEKARTDAIQPGNREWVTVIESINSTGWILPPLIIFKGQLHQLSWYERIPPNWMIGVSENGWTTDEIGLTWLKKLFGPFTEGRKVGRYRLLILDGHGSHITAQFDRYCTEHDIIVLCMPPHSSHLLQPLDVACFAVLKRSYGLGVQAQMWAGINHVDKDDFLELYLPAREATYSSKTVQSGFRATGLVPFNPDEVLERLHIQLQTPSPVRPTLETTTPWAPETPHNIAELDLQTKAIQSLIRYRTQSPPSPTIQAVNQLIKGCQMAMQSATILAAENKKLRAANEKIKKKRQKKKSYIGKGGVLTAQEVQEAQRGVENRVETEIEVVQQPSQPGPSRAPRMCSICRSLDHTARTCPERQ